MILAKRDDANGILTVIVPIIQIVIITTNDDTQVDEHEISPHVKKIT